MLAIARNREVLLPLRLARTPMGDYTHRFVGAHGCHHQHNLIAVIHAHVHVAYLSALHKPVTRHTRGWSADRKHHPLPGRLYRHGVQFDFMISFRSTEPTEAELLRFSHLLQAEVEASRTLEKIIYESRSRDRDHYTVLHRRLEIE